MFVDHLCWHVANCILTQLCTARTLARTVLQVNVRLESVCHLLSSLGIAHVDADQLPDLWHV